MSCVEGLYCPFSSAVCPSKAKDCIIGQIYLGCARRESEIGIELYPQLMDWLQNEQWRSKAKISAAPSPLGPEVRVCFPGRPLPSWPGLPPWPGMSMR